MRSLPTGSRRCATLPQPGLGVLPGSGRWDLVSLGGLVPSVRDLLVWATLLARHWRVTLAAAGISLLSLVGVGLRVVLSSLIEHLFRHLNRRLAHESGHKDLRFLLKCPQPDQRPGILHAFAACQSRLAISDESAESLGLDEPT